MRNIFKREPGLWVLIFLPLVMFMPEALNLARFAGVDHTKLNMPIKYFDVMALRQGELPLWNPFIATGAPHMAEGESGIFYIVNLINHLPGDFFYWYGINIIVHFIIAGITCYALLRYKGAGELSATIFAVLFQFAPFTMLHLAAVALFQVLAWAPLLVLLFEMALDGRKPLWNTFWGIALVFQLVCIGSPQMLTFAFLALILLGISRSILARDSRMAWRGAVFLIAIAAGGALLAAMQLLPTIDFTSDSTRSIELSREFHADGSWLDWNRLATLILFPSSDFSDIEAAIGFGSSQVYIGLLPLLMIALAIWDGGIRRRTAPYLWLLIVLLVLSFGWNFAPYRALTLIPPFSYFRFLGRTSVLFVLFSLVAGSIAFEVLIKEKAGLGRLLRNALISMAIVAALLIVIHSELVPTRAITIFIINAILTGLFVYFARKPGRAMACTVIAFVLVHLFMLYPYARMLTQTKAGFEDTFAAMDAIEADDEIELKRVMAGFIPWVVDPEGLLNPGYASRDWMIDGMAGLACTTRRVGCMHIYLPLYELKWSDIIFIRLLPNLRDNPWRIERMNWNICWILGINYIVVNSDKLDVPGFERFATEAAMHSYRPAARLYRNTKPFPRFFLTRNVRRYRLYDLWRFLRLLHEETPKDVYGIVIPDEQAPPLFPDPHEPVSGDVRIVRDGFNSYELEVSCDRDCYLIVRDNYYRGWEVTVDGKPERLFMADYVNRAVYTPAGIHRVEFIYRPEPFRKGLRISLVAFLIFIVGGAAMRWGFRL